MPRAALSLLAVLLIAATVGSKFKLQDVAAEEDLSAAVPALAARLTGQGYAVKQPRLGVPRLIATKGACATAVRLVDAHGTYRDTELRKVPRGWAPRYAWRGSWRDSLPRAEPLLGYYAARELARLGGSAGRTAVAMAYTRPGCTLPLAQAVAVEVPLRSMPSA